MNSLKARLAFLGFLEFAVWGSYLVSLGMFLYNVGLGQYIPWFYAVQGLVSLFMPGIIGMLADRYIQAQKMMSLCHIIAGTFMFAAGWYAMSALGEGEPVKFAPLFILYTISVAFFMPTIGLNNSVAFSAMSKAGLDTVKEFPPIRVFGTVGFICAEWFVNFIEVDGITIQKTFYQLFVCGVISYLLALYSLTMPACPTDRSSKFSLAEALGFSAFKLFKRKEMAVFFIFSMLLGVSLQLTNSYGTPFIELFGNVQQYASDFFAQNPTFLISLSQVSETLCILLIPICLKKFGIKGVMLMSMLAWVFRFGFFGLGNTSASGVWLLILSCIVYGVAFDFFNVSGGLYVDAQTSPKMRSSAQGLFMIMTNGIGASLGTILAGTFVVNNMGLLDSGIDAGVRLADWRIAWYIFAAYALVVAVAFYFCFKTPKEQITDTQILEAEDTESGSGGFVEKNISAE